MVDVPGGAPAPIRRSNVWDAAVLVAEFVRSLQANGFIVIGADGHYAFHDPTTMQIVAEGQSVEQILKAHGMVIPPNVDKLIQSVPMLLPLLGLTGISA